MVLRKNCIPVLLSIWALILVVGFAILYRYASTPGSPNSTLTSWPEESTESFPGGTGSLVVFLHSRCPCSRATVAELNRLLPHRPAQFHVLGILIHPDTDPSNLESSDIFQSLLKLPEVDWTQDSKLELVRAFKATTSGEVFYFNSNRDLVYHGGITPMRGHQGDSLGRESILQLFSGQIPKVKRGTAFGCALQSRTSLVVSQ